MVARRKFLTLVPAGLAVAAGIKAQAVAASGVTQVDGVQSELLVAEGATMVHGLSCTHCTPVLTLPPDSTTKPDDPAIADFMEKLRTVNWAILPAGAILTLLGSEAHSPTHVTNLLDHDLEEIKRSIASAMLAVTHPEIVPTRPGREMDPERRRFLLSQTTTGQNVLAQEGIEPWAGVSSNLAGFPDTGTEVMVIPRARDKRVQGYGLTRLQNMAVEDKYEKWTMPQQFYDAPAYKGEIVVPAAASAYED